MIQTFYDTLTNIKGFDLVLALIFAALFIIRLMFLFLFTGRILFQKKLKQTAATPVSLIYTVRNEGPRLKNNLPPVLSINDVDLEVIVVDDFSQDNSFQVLGMLRGRSDRLKVSTLHQETRFSTKMAQNLALKAAGYEWILTVPISYENASSEWISGISNALDNNKTVVVSYCSAQNSGGFINRIYRIESFLSFTKSVGYILNNFPFIYSEENVAFQKKKYFEIGGHGLKISEPYANLELLINFFIRKKTTTILFQSDTAIKKTEDLIWNDYLDILKKSLRIEKHLSGSKKAVLGFDEFTKILFPPVTIVVIILLIELWPLYSGLLFILLTSRLFIIKIAQNRLNERKIFLSSLAYDLIVPYFKFFYRWYFNNRSQKQKWKVKV
ncbi:MAG TPA: glycosyltransferase [Draconibacterium sp.]|nr:glycosyltransferase [Draconibacterium sp.]